MGLNKNLLNVYVMAGVLFPFSAWAGVEVGDWTLSANVKLASDYVWRGVSQTDEGPSLSGGFDVGHKTGFYAGVWGSNVDFNDGDEANIELDLYAGFAYTFANGVVADVGVIHYDYPGADKDLEYNFEEAYLKLGYAIGDLNLQAKYSYSDDFTASLTDEQAHYLEGAMTYKLPWGGLVLAGHYGRSFGEAFDIVGDGLPASYDDYSVGLSKEVLGMTVDLTYTDTDHSSHNRFAGGLGDGRAVLSLSRVF